MLHGLSLWYIQTFDHCVVCPSSINGLGLSLWYIQTFDHCVVCPSSINGLGLFLWKLIVPLSGMNWQ
jgi:hypothetical protein